MHKKTIIILALTLLCVIPVFAEIRTLDDIFPNLPPDIRASAFTGTGYINSSSRKSGFSYIGAGGLDPQIVNTILGKNPSHLIESLLVIPGNPDANLLDAYNALGNIRGLKGILYHSDTRNRKIPLFEDATRIVSDKKTTAIPDPNPARNIPAAEIIYVRLKDTNFGNTYYRAEISLFQDGLVYRLSNFRNISFLFIPIIKEEKLNAQLYIEPIQEGILIYGFAGADVSDFIASMVDMGSSVGKRLAVIISWIADGIIKPK
jgi:hypothetical protein